MWRTQRIALLFVASVVLCLPQAYAQARPKTEASQRQIAREFFKVEGDCKNLIKSRKLNEAEPTCKRLTQLADQFAEGREIEKMNAYELFGHVMAWQGRYPEALESYSHASDSARQRLTETDAETGRLYWDKAMVYYAMRDLDKARDLFRQAEKTYRLAYANIGDDEIREPYMKSLKEILQYHLKAAEEAGAATEVEELKKQLNELPPLIK